MARLRALYRDAAAVLLLWGLVLALTWRIALAGRVLAAGDIFTYFYPYWAEATRAIRAARVPLWNPYLFMGAPFLANSQVGLFYPLNWPLWLLLPAHRAVHVTLVLHLCLAALNAYMWGRGSLRLGRQGAWTVAAIFALGGYLGAQLEHVNQLQGLAWLPLILKLYDRVSDPGAPVSGKKRAFVGLAVAIALILLAGHAQTAFIALVGLGVYGLGPQVWQGVRSGKWRPLLRGAVLLGSAAALGGATAAVQLVPTWELSRLSIRAGGLPFNERVSFSLSPLYAGRALLPGLAQPVPPDHLEHVAYVGVAGLAMALMECVSAFPGRRGQRSTPVSAPGSKRLAVLLLTFLGLFFALGLYNPVYLLLARGVPGFAHFRVPARWLALFALGAAALAGRAVDRLWMRKHQGRGRVLMVAVVLFLVGLWALIGSPLSGEGGVGLWSILGWAGAALVAIGVLLGAERAPRFCVLVLLTLLVAELLLATTSLPHSRATAPQAFTSMRPAIAHLLASEPSDSAPPARFLSMSDITFDPGDLALINTIYGPQLSGDQLYAYVVASKQKEVVAPNLSLAFGLPAVDGYDGGVLPLGPYIALQHLFLPEEEVSIDGRLRENLTAIPDGRWLSLFNVRHVITDKLGDAWIDDVFYDLQFGARLVNGEEAAVGHVPRFESTALGLVSHLEEGTGLATGTPVGVVELIYEDGGERLFELRAGEDVTERSGAEGEGRGRARRLSWEGPATPLTVTVRAVLPRGVWAVRGLSLIDERTGSFQSLVLSDRGSFRLAHSGDVKVYENLEVLPRALIVHQAQWVDDDAAALAAMQDATFDPSSEAVLGPGDCSCAAFLLDQTRGADPGKRGEAQHLSTASIVEYQPERVVIDVQLDERGILLLTDTLYPGWEVRVEGEPVPICQADLLFRAVPLDPGEHQVVFAFRPVGPWAGATLSALGLLVLTVVLVVRPGPRCVAPTLP